MEGRGGGVPRRDPFEGLVLDDAFVAGAHIEEPTAADRARRDREASRPPPRGPRRRLSSRARRGVGVAAVLVALLGLGVWASPEGASAPRAWSFDDALAGDRVGIDRPTPDPGAREPLGTPPVVTVSGAHEFMATGRDGEPVAFDPCRAVRFVVNDRTAPAAAEGLVDEAVEIVAAATGLRLEHVGSTDESPAFDHEAFQPERYGDTWAPALVAWTDEAEVAELGRPISDEVGDPIGLGGPNPVRIAGAPDVYVSGTVMLDGPEMARLLDEEGGRDAARAVVVHELAHMLGLAHVEDPEELMYEGPGGATVLGPGDREGLAALGAGPCVPEV